MVEGVAGADRMKTILITGGARGIGRACAAFFHELGWNVATVDLLPVETCDRWEHLVGDVSCETTAQRIVQQAVQRFGQLDVLVNNAGRSTSRAFCLEELPLDEWNRVLGVNLTGAFLMAKHAAPHLRRTRGSIVNIASTRALQSEPHGEAYAASKGGLLALTHALAVSLGPDIRVNCISPGWIETREEDCHREADRMQHPAGRVGTPRDIAGLVDYLSGAGFVTGQNVVADGGMTVKMIYEE